jgi:hypothetical protein
MNLISTNGDALCQIATGKTSASGVSSKPLTDVYINAQQNINDSTDTLIVWTSVGYDTDGMWNPGTPNHLTVQTAGKYRISAGVDWGGNATGIRAGKIMVNGTANANVVSGVQFSASSAFDTVANTHVTIPLAAGATVYFDVYQTSTVVSFVTTAYGGTWLVVEWVSP